MTGVQLYGPGGITGSDIVSQLLHDLSVSVDALKAGSGQLTVVKAVATTAQALGGLPVIDGYQTVAGDVVLLTAQAGAADNGLWSTFPGVWDRPKDFAAGQLVTSRTVVASAGTANAGMVWALQTAAAVTVGTTAQVWVNAVAAEASARSSADAAVYTRVRPFAVGPPAGGAAANKDKAAAATVIAACLASDRGGDVVFDAGETYNLGDLSIALPQDPNRSMNVRSSQGRRATRLQFATDTARQTFAIAGASTAGSGGACFNTISDLMLVGPGGGSRAAGLGNSPANKDGVRLHAGIIVERCDISGFRSGLVNVGDHTICREITSHDNYYGLCYEGQVSTGDNDYYSCDFGGNLRASIGLAAVGGQMVTARFFGCHLGIGPYAIYFEPGSSVFRMQGCLFDGTSWEAVGNGHIFGADAFIDRLRLNNCGNFSFGPGFAIPGETVQKDIKVASITNSSITGDGPTQWDCNIINALTWDGWKPAFARAVALGGPMFVAAGLANGGNGRIELRNADCRAAAHLVYPGFAVTKGQLVELAPGGYVWPHAPNGANGGSILFGVAMNDATGSTPCIVAKEDYDGVWVNAVGGGYGINELLFPDAGTPTSVNRPSNVAGYATKAIVGRVSSPNIVGGQVLALIRPVARPT